MQELQNILITNQSNSIEACEYVCAHSGAVVACVEDEAQLNKFLAIRDNLPKLQASKWIVDC